MFKICDNKLCEDYLCDDCNRLVPSMCGNVNIPVFVNAPCGNVYFTGITDIKVRQFGEVDLVSGVHAYDKNDHEIFFDYEPKTIDTSEVGTYTVAYTASGLGDSIVPIVCGKNAVHVTDCDHSTTTVYRTVTVRPNYAVACESEACKALAGCERSNTVVCQAKTCEALVACNS